MSRYRDILRSDEGFSLAEVVIAAAILFFVLTAIVGLVGVSSQMTVQAKQVSVLTNAVASYIDEIRAYSWEDIAATDADGDSIYVPPTTTRVIEGVTIVFETAIEDRLIQGDEFMKNIRVTAIATLAGKTQTYTTRVAVRNPNYNRTLAVDPDNPTISFESPTPADNEVLFVNERLSGGVIRMRTNAASPVGTINQVRYEVAGRLLRNQLGGGGQDALFSPDPPVANLVSESYWDTRQEGVIDGVQTVIATAEDDQARTASARRQYIIDNSPAVAPGTPGLSAAGPRSIVASWAAARDGGSDATPYWASQYQWILSKEPTAGAAGLTDWTLTASETVPAGPSNILAIRNAGPISASVQAPVSATPFGRYWLRVFSGSPRGNFTNYTDSGIVMTNPDIYCGSTFYPYDSMLSSVCSTTVRNMTPKYCDYSTVLWVSKPSFPISAIDYVSIQVSADNVTWTPVTWGGRNILHGIETSDPRAVKIRFTYSESGSTARALYFRTVVAVTPVGGSATTIPSRAVGRTSTTNGGLVNLNPY